MPVAGSGDMFAPTTDPTDQQPAQGSLGQIMPGSTASPMQPPQSPEEHAQNKAGWLDWLRDPSTAAFMMQFGASMLQPNPRGFGAQLGQSLGEGGEAVARVAGQERETAAQQSKSAEEAAQAEYARAEAKAQPTLAAAREQASQARLEAAQTKSDVASQMMWFNQMRENALAQNDLASAQRYKDMADALALQTKYPLLKQFQTEHENWAKDFQQGLTTADKEPKPENYGIPRNVLYGGAPTAAPAGGTQAQQPPPMPVDTPDFVSSVRSMDAATRDALTQEYFKLGGKYWTGWQTVLSRLHGDPSAGRPPVATGVAPGTVTRQPGPHGRFTVPGEPGQ